jgi:hypothetical protein
LEGPHSKLRYNAIRLAVVHEPSGHYIFTGDPSQDRTPPKFVFTAEGADWECWLNVNSEETRQRAAALGILLPEHDRLSLEAFREKHGKNFYIKHPVNDAGKIPTPWSTDLVSLLAHLLLGWKTYVSTDNHRLFPDSFDFRPPNVPAQFHHNFEHLLTGKPQP